MFQEGFQHFQRGKVAPSKGENQLFVTILDRLLYKYYNLKVTKSRFYQLFVMNIGFVKLMFQFTNCAICTKEKSHTFFQVFSGIKWRNCRQPRRFFKLSATFCAHLTIPPPKNFGKRATAPPHTQKRRRLSHENAAASPKPRRILTKTQRSRSDLARKNSSIHTAALICRTGRVPTSRTAALIYRTTTAGVSPSIKPSRRHNRPLHKKEHRAEQPPPNRTAPRTLKLS